MHVYVSMYVCVCIYVYIMYMCALSYKSDPQLEIDCLRFVDQFTCAPGRCRWDDYLNVCLDTSMYPNFPLLVHQND